MLIVLSESDKQHKHQQGAPLSITLRRSARSQKYHAQPSWRQASDRTLMVNNQFSSFEKVSPGRWAARRGGK